MPLLKSCEFVASKTNHPDKEEEKVPKVHKPAEPEPKSLNPKYEYRNRVVPNKCKI